MNLELLILNPQPHTSSKEAAQIALIKNNNWIQSGYLLAFGNLASIPPDTDLFLVDSLWPLKAALEDCQSQ